MTFDWQTLAVIAIEIAAVAYLLGLGRARRRGGPAKKPDVSTSALVRKKR